METTTHRRRAKTVAEKQSPSVTVEQLPEHELICGSEPALEHGEGEAVAEQQPPRASGCEAAMSSRGRLLVVVEASIPEKHKAPYLARQMSKWFYDISTDAATGAARCGSFVGGSFGLLVTSY
jgi:hypothetical protein